MLRAMRDRRLIQLDFDIQTKRNDEARKLIQQLGIDVRLGADGTPLLVACLYDNQEIAEYCLERSASVDSVDSRGATPLMYAAENGNLALVTALVERGADVNARDRYEMTPITNAISDHADKLDLIEFLLAHGADPFIEIEHSKGHPGAIANSAAQLAKALRKTAVVALIERMTKRPIVPFPRSVEEVSRALDASAATGKQPKVMTPKARGRRRPGGAGKP